MPITAQQFNWSFIGGRQDDMADESNRIESNGMAGDEESPWCLLAALPYSVDRKVNRPDTRQPASQMAEIQRNKKLQTNSHNTW